MICQLMRSDRNNLTRTLQLRQSSGSRRALRAGTLHPQDCSANRGPSVIACTAYGPNQLALIIDAWMIRNSAMMTTETRQRLPQHGSCGTLVAALENSA
mmetsp:Transcript_36571/g.68084  ORF Transcript_36571/g.68084 Transcript_36571/m.68084 type:complete len:99 (+) Transcript_36571:196-492(+)